MFLSVVSVIFLCLMDPAIKAKLQQQCARCLVKVGGYCYPIGQLFCCCALPFCGRKGIPNHFFFPVGRSKRTPLLTVTIAEIRGL